MLLLVKEREEKYNEKEMLNFEFEFPTKIVFGEGVFDSLADYLEVLGDRILVVTGKRFATEHGYVDRIKEMLKEKNLIFYSSITPNPKTFEVEKGAELAKEEKVSGVLAFGGGSVMDAAKVIAGLVISGGKVWDYAPYREDKRKFTGALPIVTVPTVAASGSEANPYAVITNPEAKEKIGFYSPYFYPAVAVIDPSLTYSLPFKFTADGVVDIMVHALETYFSGHPAYLQDRFTESLIHTVMEAWEWLLQEERIEEARAILSWSSTLAISPFLHEGREGHYVLHGIEHPVSAYYDHISHGSGLAALLIPYLSFFLEKRSERLTSLFKALFDISSPEEGLNELKRWMREHKLEVHLSQLGVEPSKLSEIARHAYQISSYRFDEIEMKVSDIEDILRAAL